MDELIGLVGPCASGKSTLAKRLIQQGYRVRQIAQEHSVVPDMWLRLSNPDVLIFLDVSYQATLQRRGASWWTLDEYQQQLERLRHAREHADLYIDTSYSSPNQIAEQVLKFLVSE